MDYNFFAKIVINALDKKAAAYLLRELADRIEEEGEVMIMQERSSKGEVSCESYEDAEVWKRLIGLTDLLKRLSVFIWLPNERFNETFERRESKFNAN